MPISVVSLVRSTSTQLALSFCLWATFPSHAQLRSLDVSQYLHTAWTAQEGFFRGGVSSVAQTSDGYLWLTSTAGLVRFDGVRFVEWKPSGEDSLPGQPLSSLMGSKTGSLWIGGTGLTELTVAGQFRRYHHLDHLRSVQLVETKDGAIWAGGWSLPGSAPLCRVSPEPTECYGDSNFMGGFVGSLYEDEQGRLWAGTADGVWRVSPGPPQKRAASSGFIQMLATDPAGGLLFSNGPQIKVLSNDGKLASYPILGGVNSTEASAILKDRENNLWIGTRGKGLVHVHQGRIDRFSTLDGLSFDDVWGIFQDREGSIWVVTSNSLDRFTKPAVPRSASKQGLSSDEVFSVLNDRNGIVWIGTSGGLDQLIDGRLVRSRVRLPSNNVLTLFEHSNGRLLVATGDGMVWIEGNKAIPLRARVGENIFEIAEDRHGDLWIASREAGLLHLTANGDLVQSFQWKDLGIGSYSVAFDPLRDGIWLASATGDLAFFKNGKIALRYGPGDGLGTGVLRDIQVDKDGAVWVATRLGLARLMDNKVTTLGTKNGLPCDAVHWMRHDRDQNVWLYTECGLVSFSNRNLSSWIAQPSYKVTVKSYLDNTRGVENVSYSGWYTPQAAITTDGRMLFASLSGMGVLDPRSLDQNALAPPVHIEQVTVDGRELARAEHLSLPTKARSIHISYSALSLVAPRKVRFRYKLQGFDPNWSEPVSLREVTYTNLSPGDYEFRVIACNNDGVWNETGAAVTFTMPPAFTQTGWFAVLCVSAFLGLVYSAYRSRVRYVTKQLRGRMYERLAERERIAMDLHDTFFQGIQGLLLRFHTATSQLREEDPARKIFEETLKQSDEVMLEGRGLVFNWRATATEPTDLPTVFAGYGEQIQHARSCSFKVVVNGSVRPLHPVVFEEISKIGKEALGNAFRHSAAKAVEAELNYEPSELRICIRDDGTGIESNIVQRGFRDGHFGLPGMRERAHKIGAHFDLRSRTGTGTEVELRISAALAYASGQNGSVLAKLRRAWRKHKKGTHFS